MTTTPQKTGIVDLLTDFLEKTVRIYAIYYIASMELELIRTGQDGTWLPVTAFVIGLIAGVKISDLKCLIKK
jgi:hypothetical protein